MDLTLTSLAATETRPYSITGLRINGHSKDVELAVKWTGASDEYQRAVDALAFRKLETGSEEWARAIIKLAAQHLVAGWTNVPDGLAYSTARGEQVLGAFLTDKRMDRLYRFLAFVSAGDNFQRDLVDAFDLGKA